MKQVYQAPNVTVGPREGPMLAQQHAIFVIMLPLVVSLLSLSPLLPSAPLFICLFVSVQDICCIAQAELRSQATHQNAEI